MYPSQTDSIQDNNLIIGVGLRSAHYHEALAETPDIDFVELHTENFISGGSFSQTYLQQLSEYHEISLHCVSMGLGSAQGLRANYLRRLKPLVDLINPVLVSDHACFCWGTVNNHAAHAGDLLPLERTSASLSVTAQNIDRVQQLLGRSILIENVSAYLPHHKDEIPEPVFLAELAEKTGCGLLVDLNNLLVNAHNFSHQDPLQAAVEWLKQIPPSSIGEYHLAGTTPVPAGELLIDDHGCPISNSGWAVYRQAVQHSGPKPTLIEWDNNLPTWDTLINEARTARIIAFHAVQQVEERRYG